MAAMMDNYVFDKAKLLRFGFVEQNGGFYFSKSIMQGQFELRITIAATGVGDWYVWDTAAEDVYQLVKIDTACGAFVGEVRTACAKVLQALTSQCGTKRIFKSEQALQIMRYVHDKYGDKFEYLWEKTPQNAVFRRQDNQKWYGAVLTVKKDRLGFSSEETAEILDLRGHPEEIAQIVDGKKYFPAYHMNKKNWLTICLDNSLELNEIYRRIDDSYMLAKK